MEIKILGDWENSLMWCPSQCCLPIEFKDKKYWIYLRWKWDDPWRCHLLDENGNFVEDKAGNQIDLFEAYSEGGKRFYYRRKELKKAKKKVLELAERWLIENV